MDSGDEIVLIVDEDNRETGAVPRREMRAQGLAHRASYILVFNSKDVVTSRQPHCFEPDGLSIDGHGAGSSDGGESHPEALAQVLDLGTEARLVVVGRVRLAAATHISNPSR